MARALPVAVLALWLALAGWLTHGFRCFTTYSAALAAAGPVPRPAPDFTFTDQAGATRRLSSLRDRWVLVNFLYLDCPAACPLVTAELGRIRDQLESRAPGAVELLSVDFEPDPPEKVRRMWLARGAPAGWTMGVLRPAEADAALRRFGVYVYRRPDGVINHALYLFLIDPAGAIRRVDAPDVGPAALATAIAGELGPVVARR